MADDKKKPAGGGKPVAGGSGLFHKDHHKEVFWLLAALFLISFILQNLLGYFSGLESTFLGGLGSLIADKVAQFWPIWKGIALAHVVVGAIWAVYSLKKLRALSLEEEKIYGVATDGALLASETIIPDEGNKKWLRIQELINSGNPSDWRLAIIEADVMLEDLLRAGGYDGEGVADLLNAVDPSDMLTLNAAWEAHKVRNRVAHAGSNFDLTEREAKRVIGLFESVFREFDIV